MKITFIAFIDSNGLIHKEFVATDKTVNPEYYKSVMDRLLERNAPVGADFQDSKDWLLLDDNVPAYNAPLIR